MSKKKPNSRWNKGAERYSAQKFVEASRWEKMPDGSRRRVEENVSQADYAKRFADQHGWHGGAKVRVK